MYFRRKRSHSGSVLQLVESYRNHENRPRHRVVLSLGDAPIPKADWPLIAKGVERKLAAQQVLLDNTASERVGPWIDTVIRRIDGKKSPSPTETARFAPETLEPTEDLPQSRCQRSRFPAAPSGTLDENEVIDGVLIHKITHTHTTRLGPELLANHAYDRLALDDVLARGGFNPAQRMAARASIINRVVDPVAEQALPHWVKRSSLPDLLGDGLFSASKDRYYRVSDQLLRHPNDIEAHLRERHRTLFNLRQEIILYDLTNSHFEGVCAKNPKARYGKNKQKRNDCPPIVVGLVLDGDGFPLTHKIFDGNQSDAKSLLAMVEAMRKSVASDAELFSVKKPLVIVDAGVATKGNLKVLRDAGFHYLVNDSRRGRTRYAEQFQQETLFETIPGRDATSPVKVAKMRDPRGADEETAKHEGIDPPAGEPEGGAVVDEVDQIVLCKSERREVKEKAMLSQAEARYGAALEKLARRIETGRLTDEKKINQALGRLASHHSRVKRYFEVKVETVAPTGSEPHDALAPTTPLPQRKKRRGANTPRVTRRWVWNRRETEYAAAEALSGCYVLRTDVNEMSGSDLWGLYMTLTRAEDAFRNLKHTLGLRPNRHHLEGRVDAHVWITILAYSLLRFIQHTLEAQGDYRSWETIKRVLMTHAYTTIIVPSTDGHLHRLRRAGTPEHCQEEVYRCFGIDRLKLPYTRSIVRYRRQPTEEVSTQDG